MNGVCVIAQFPPPIHGLSKAVETLYDSSLKEKYHFTRINITNNKHIVGCVFTLLFSKCDVFYLTLSQTKGGNWRDLLFLKLIAWKKKKCIVHLHGGYYRTLIDKDCGNFQRNCNRRAIQQLDACIVLGNSLISVFDGLINRNKIHVVPNCVDNQYMPFAVQEKANMLLVQSQLHILYLSNFIASKGYREVLELALKVKEEGKTEAFHFHFAGKFFEEEEESYFFSFIQKYHLEGSITYHSIVSGKKKNDLLHLCHIFILLTRYPNEGQPISILEAMGNGMSIVTTNHAGIPDIVNAENGLICSKNSIQIDSLFLYLLDCYQHRDLLRNICFKNHALAQSLYTESQYIHNMDNVFDEVCHA